MQLAIIVLWATMSLATSAKSCMPAYLDVSMDWIVQGTYPYVSSNGANTVDLFMLELSTNSTVGKCFGQCNWSGLTNVLSTWETFQIILSDAPFDWGWKAVDFASLTPKRQCSSVQNSNVNFGS